MGNASAASGRAKSNSESQGPSDARLDVDVPLDPSARLTPVMPVPDWLRELDDRDGVTPGHTPDEDGENQFFDEPPRYSVANFLSLAPTALQPHSRWRVWGARLLFGTIFCAVMALLGFEAKSLSRSAVLTRVIAGQRQ